MENAKLFRTTLMFAGTEAWAIAFKQAKFYFRFQNDRAKGRIGPSWAVTLFTEVILRVFNR